MISLLPIYDSIHLSERVAYYRVKRRNYTVRYAEWGITDALETKGNHCTPITYVNIDPETRFDHWIELMSQNG